MTRLFSCQREKSTNHAIINEATDTHLKVIERLRHLGWKRGDTLFYQKEYVLSSDDKEMQTEALS